jgi:hypothetical protein
MQQPGQHQVGISSVGNSIKLALALSLTVLSPIHNFGKNSVLSAVSNNAPVALIPH